MVCALPYNDDVVKKPIGADRCHSNNKVTFFMPKCPAGYTAMGMTYATGKYYNERDLLKHIDPKFRCIRSNSILTDGKNGLLTIRGPAGNILQLYGKNDGSYI